jgi:hypothetical protein
VKLPWRRKPPVDSTIKFDEHRAIMESKGLYNESLARALEAGSDQLFVPSDEVPGTYVQRNVPLGDDYFAFGGMAYRGNPTAMSIAKNQEVGGQDYESYVNKVFKGNSIVWACEQRRLNVFGEARPMYRQVDNGRPGDLHASPASRLNDLHEPWTNATFSDLLVRALLHADFAGNAYIVKYQNQFRLLRPDWVYIVMGSMDNPAANADDIEAEVVAYAYFPGGLAQYGENKPPVILMPDEVCHFAPMPDPMAHHKGMSWLTPLFYELAGDQAANSHKLQFFKNGASLQYVVSLDKEIKPDAFNRFVAQMKAQTQGVGNAYKTLYMGGGADVTPVGADLRQLDFKTVQGAGEPLALDTPVPTPSGWTTMGEITPGDEVLGRDGKPARVVAVSPVHVDRKCYKITFKDRTSIVADEGHLWVAMDRDAAGRPERQYTTEQLYGLVNAPRREHAHRVGVPASPVLDLPEKDLLVDPYVLGAWLGDGYTAGAAICGAADDLKHIAAEVEAAGYVTTPWDTHPEKVSVIGIPGGLLCALRALGVLNDKKIPTDYLRASAPQRLALLQGLMDTDGSVDGGGSCQFSSKWQHLALQVAELIRSLGYRATVSSHADSRSRTGAHWVVQFRSDPAVMPFRLPRKVERVSEPHVRTRTIVSIEEVESVPVRCIAVDTPDHLFLAGESMVPTHNTRIAAAAGVPPIIAGLSEGLSAGTYNNYGQAKRSFVDGTIRPLWRNFFGSLQTIVRPPNGSELFYDDRDIPYLREDEKDRITILQMEAATLAALISAGYEPDASNQAVKARDLTILAGHHTGLFSVQLQPPLLPGQAPTANASGTMPTLDASGKPKGAGGGVGQPKTSKPAGAAGMAASKVSLPKAPSPNPPKPGPPKAS